MPSRNSVKVYSEDSYYHVYNRGVEKREIFKDDQDYSVFLSYLRTYLTPKDTISLQYILANNKVSRQEKDKALKQLKLKNYSDDISLHCYALLPNHFHLLVKQNKNTLSRFMNSLCTRYAMYFNRKYNRVGVLFQDMYKGVLVQDDDQLLTLSRYINLNPVTLLGFSATNWSKAPYPCSLPEYLGLKSTPWLKTDAILEYFSRTTPKSTYEDFLGMDVDPMFYANQAIDFDTD